MAVVHPPGRGRLVGVCGRYTSTTPVPDLAAVYEVDEIKVDEHPPSWNVAPTQPVLTVATSRSGDKRMLGQMRWGLVPSWAKDPSVGSRMINARAETLATKSAFARAFETRRCIVTCDGYYEWLREPAADGGSPQKRPFWIHPTDGGPMALGGLWEVWYDAEGQKMVTCAIVTTPANPRTAPIHDRMPLILPPEVWDRWLAPTPLDDHEAARILVPAPDHLLELRPIVDSVNNVRNDGPELLQVARRHESGAISP